MSTAYCTPQRIVTGHTSRFVNRVRSVVVGAAPAPLELHAWFEPALLFAGEKKPVSAQFAAGVTWSAVSAAFTLWAAGAPAPGYNGAAATLASDPSGRLFTASATIDLTADAEYPLQGGIYIGEFLVTASTGEIAAARGPVTIVMPGSGASPVEYETGGGLD